MSNMNIDMHNSVRPSEIVDIIKTSIQTIHADPELVYDIPPTMLRGAPGVGKSAIVRQIARDLNIGFVDVRLAQMERVDVSGLPAIADGMTEWLPPQFWPRQKDSRGIIFFDEITSAPADVQVAAYSLVLDRAVPNSNYNLPDGWYIVAAGNRDTDKAVAKPMSSALANRFAHYELDADAEQWNDWAISKGLHPSVTGFINYRPTLLFTMKDQDLQQGWPSPRSWHRVANILPKFKDNETVLQKVVFGLIGQSVGTEFLAFHKMSKNFDSVVEMLTNPKAKLNIPKRSDERFAMTSAVAYHIWRGADEKEDMKRTEGMLRIALELTDDFATMLVKACTQGNQRVNRLTAIKYIMTSKLYKKFNEKFGASMKKKYSLDLAD